MRNKSFFLLNRFYFLSKAVHYEIDKYIPAECYPSLVLRLTLIAIEFALSVSFMF